MGYFVDGASSTFKGTKVEKEKRDYEKIPRQSQPKRSSLRKYNKSRTMPGMGFTLFRHPLQQETGYRAKSAPRLAAAAYL